MTHQHEASTPRRRKVKKADHDTLATTDGVAIPIWRPGATDPIDYLASVMDELPAPGRSRSTKHREG